MTDVTRRWSCIFFARVLTERTPKRAELIQKITHARPGICILFCVRSLYSECNCDRLSGIVDGLSSDLRRITYSRATPFTCFANRITFECARSRSRLTRYAILRKSKRVPGVTPKTRITLSPRGRARGFIRTIFYFQIDIVFVDVPGNNRAVTANNAFEYYSPHNDPIISYNDRTFTRMTALRNVSTPVRRGLLENAHVFPECDSRR